MQPMSRVDYGNGPKEGGGNLSWVKIDDGAYEHTKLLDAGVKAAWLWLCCLSYCNRQKRRDGLVPKSKIELLYPGVGLKEAKRLVEVGLLEELKTAFSVHDYHEYQPSESLSDARSMAGKQGGIKSGEARRSKREASASGNGEAPNEAPARPDPGPTHTTPKPPDVAVGKIRCPTDLELTESQRGQLMLVPDWAVTEITRRFRAQWVDSTDGDRSLDQWRRSLSAAVSATWNDPTKRPKDPKAAPSPREKPSDEEPKWL